jgi:hypothetical protein
MLLNHRILVNLFIKRSIFVKTIKSNNKTSSESYLTGFSIHTIYAKILEICVHYVVITICNQICSSKQRLISVIIYFHNENHYITFFRETIV